MNISRDTVFYQFVIFLLLCSCFSLIVSAEDEMGNADQIPIHIHHPNEILSDVTLPSSTEITIRDSGYVIVIIPSLFLDEINEAMIGSAYYNATIPASRFEVTTTDNATQFKFRDIKPGEELTIFTFPQSSFWVTNVDPTIVHLEFSKSEGYTSPYTDLKLFRKRTTIILASIENDTHSDNSQLIICSYYFDENNETDTTPSPEINPVPEFPAAGRELQPFGNMSEFFRQPDNINPIFSPPDVNIVTPALPSNDYPPFVSTDSFRPMEIKFY